MGYDRHWQEAIGSEDAHGRAIWALGQTVLDSPSPGMVGAAMTLFERSLPAVSSLSSPRRRHRPHLRSFVRPHYF